MQRGLIAALVLVLVGCATAPGTGGRPSGEAAQEQGPLDTHASVKHNVDNRAVALLWDKAEAARREDRVDDAVAALERALRLAPEDAVLWSRLAEMRLRKKDFAVAENLAAKSNALAGDQRLLRYRNWLIIAEARARRGDEEGADKARREAERLRAGTS